MRVVWGEAGSRKYETGIDRGVLYVGSASGVPWNGLISVNEAKIGGEVAPVYQDGIKKHNSLSPEEYSATIEAYSYPDSFAQCDGLGALGGGLYADDQPRASFGLSYRTLIGSDLKQTDHGYKIHFVYNAMAQPPSRSYKSIAASPAPTVLSWAITTTPVKIAGRRASAHLVVDSTKTAASKLTAVENILYGTSTTNPRLPTVAELIALMV